VVREVPAAGRLDEARRGTLPGLVKTNVTFAEAAD
jgi:hypothetical protein